MLSLEMSLTRFNVIFHFFPTKYILLFFFARKLQPYCSALYASLALFNLLSIYFRKKILLLFLCNPSLLLFAESKANK